MFPLEALNSEHAPQALLDVAGVELLVSGEHIGSPLVSEGGEKRGNTLV